MHPNMLHVVTCVSNPCRYKSRYKLYKEFEQHILDAGAVLWTIEASFGERPHEVTEKYNVHHIQVNTQDELWLKENLLNLAIARLPAEAKYIAIVDADVHFVRPDFAAETVHALQHYHWVQMFSVAQDLGPNFEPFQTHYGFVYSWQNTTEPPITPYGMNRYGGKFHPGYAWAFTKDAINKVGGLLDVGVVGSGDHHMAHALYGLAEKTVPKGAHPNYKKAILQWQDRAKGLHQDIGYVPGLINHYWHGKKRDRRYANRWEIIVKNNFDPQIDLIRDWQGLYQIPDHRIQLRDDLRNYFRARNEDSIDL